MWDLKDLPTKVQLGAAYATLPLLTLEGDAGGYPRHVPISAPDEEGRPRPYLPARQGPGLVIAEFEGDIVWLAPLVTELDFQNLHEARAFIELVQQHQVGGWIHLPALPGWPAGGIAVPLACPTLLAIRLVENLTQTSGLAPLGKLAPEGLAVLSAALGQLFVDQVSSA